MPARLFSIGGKTKGFSFKCADCGEIHRGSPSFAYEKPVYYFEVPEAEREARITINSDLCEIRPAQGGDENPICAIRGTLEIPIHGADEPFCWGVWAAQSKDNFDRYRETFDADQSAITTFGWLAVAMRVYGRTQAGEPIEHLRCDVDWGPAGKRPEIRLHECDHALFLDQRDGISWDRAIEIARTVIHGST